MLPSGPPITDPWAPSSPTPKLPSTGVDPWGASVETSNTSALGGASPFDPFAKPLESTEPMESWDSAQALPKGKSPSPVELDPFGDSSPSCKQNGVKETEALDLGVLGEALTQQPGKEARPCRTPESFLGPSASSLVNLDSLVKAPLAARTRNPFLTGLSAPSPTNPFGAGEQGRPTLNQMRTGSPALGLPPGGPVGVPLGSMTYSASLPLPLSSVPVGATLPASVSVFPQAGAFAPPPASLPQPLLPTSDPVGPLPPQAGTNPFL